MKKPAILLFAVLLFAQANAQETRHEWTLSATLAHYGEADNELRFSDDNNSFAPGLELLYGYRLTPSVCVKTGLAFQHARFISRSNFFRIGELSLPLLCSVSKKVGKKSAFSLTSGVYAGRYLYFLWDKSGHGDWKPVNTDYQDEYSSKNFFADFYVGLAFSRLGSAGNKVSIAPFLRYRIKENWMKIYQANTYYGVKLGVTLRSAANDK